jgi:hypothetical protein
VLRVASNGMIHQAGWVNVDESYGVSRCGFSFGVDGFNKGPWLGALWRNLGASGWPGWIRQVEESTEVDCMACIAKELP